MSRWRQLGLAALATLLLAACASTASDTTDAPPGEEPALFELTDETLQQGTYVIDVYDPWERMNRSIYRFNAVADHAFILPVTQLYNFVTPEIVQDRVSNFFSNITELTTLANALLQAKGEKASRALVRFVVNSTVGILGLFDPMTKLGTAQQREDFGQTLGVWGVGDGPYMVLPLLGPSNLRDTTGLVTDTVAFTLIDPFNIATLQSDYPGLIALRAIDLRNSIGLSYYESGSAFEYEFLRLLYTKMRQLDITK